MDGECPVLAPLQSDDAAGRSCWITSRIQAARSAEKHEESDEIGAMIEKEYEALAESGFQPGNIAYT